jgi:hypothetical protein
MKAHYNLIASVAAVLFTVASLSAVNYNAANHTIGSQPTATGNVSTVRVTELAPVNVRPSAAELRAAALQTDIGTVGIATLPGLGHIEGGGTEEQFSLLGSPLAMPYYSFGNKFGHVSKE